MSKEKVRGFILGIVFTLTIASSFGVLAEGQSIKSINAVYNNIKLVIDGKPVSFGKDSAGNSIEPFIYNGTTYLPVRAVGETIGKKVDWDGLTQTVYIGEKPGEISYLTETIQPYMIDRSSIYRLNNSTKLEMGGVKYNTGYILKHAAGNPSIYWNLNGQYNEITGYLGSFLVSDRNLNIYIDGKLYDTIVVKGGAVPQKITIPVIGVNQLHLELIGYGGIAGLGDLIIK